MRKQASTNRTKKSVITKAALLGVTLLSTMAPTTGCVITPPPLTLSTETSSTTEHDPGEKSGKAKIATQISGIDTMETDQGVRIALESDGILPFKLFKLETPPRFLLTFPEIRLEPGIQPKILDFPNVTGLFPSEEEQQNSQLEVTLQEMAEYTIHERDNGLDLTILSKFPDLLTENGYKAQANAHIKNVQVLRNEEGTHIHLLGSGFIPEPKIFRLHNPPQLIVDFPGLTGLNADHAQEIKKVPVISQEIEELHLASGPQKTRLAIKLKDPHVMFWVDRKEGLPIIHLTHTPSIAEQTTTAHNIHPTDRQYTSVAPRQNRQANQITPQIYAVDFSTEESTGILKIRMNTGHVVLESHREDKVLTLILKGTTLASRLSHQKTGGQRMDVHAFGSPIKTVDIYTENKNTLVVARVNRSTDRHEIIQQGKSILLQVKPEEKLLGREKKRIYTGEKISMDFKDIDIQNALRLLAEVKDLNMLTTDSVQGTITMRLVEVPWDQALDMILEAKGLGKVLQGNVLRIAPMEEIQSMAETRLKAQKSNLQLEPIITEMLPVSFAKASDIRTLLMEGDQGKGTRLLSQSGSVSIDQRTNTLIVKDMTSNLSQIREMVKDLDKPIPQVLIEARIVEVHRDSRMDLGINWGFNYKGSARGSLGVSNTSANAYQVQQSDAEQEERRPLMSGEIPPLNVSLLPKTMAGQIGIHLGSVSPLLDLDIELGALESRGKAKTISSPRVLTTDNQAASISQGSRQPYPTQAEGGGTTYDYIDAALSLRVTPHVTANGFITLEVNATNNSPGTALSGPPPINTKEVQTQALVKNGETIVLGGIFQNSQSNGQSSIPMLHEIPYLGWLFKNKTTSNNQSELLIFITPRIINPS